MSCGSNFPLNNPMCALCSINSSTLQFLEVAHMSMKKIFHVINFLAKKTCFVSTNKILWRTQEHIVVWLKNYFIQDIAGKSPFVATWNFLFCCFFSEENQDNVLVVKITKFKRTKAKCSPSVSRIVWASSGHSSKKWFCLWDPFFRRNFHNFDD